MANTRQWQLNNRKESQRSTSDDSTKMGQNVRRGQNRHYRGLQFSSCHRRLRFPFLLHPPATSRQARMEYSKQQMDRRAHGDDESASRVEAKGICSGEWPIVNIIYIYIYIYARRRCSSPFGLEAHNFGFMILRLPTFTSLSIFGIFFLTFIPFCIVIEPCSFDTMHIQPPQHTSIRPSSSSSYAHASRHHVMPFAVMLFYLLIVS